MGELTTFVEIEDNRHITNTGYFSFGKDTFDILDVKYIYQIPEFVLRQYGSRMLFCIKMPDGKLRQSPLREQAYSNDTIVALLEQLKQIKPTIELDPEYEKIVSGKMYIDEMSQNTISSVEARLRAKGERW